MELLLATKVDALAVKGAEGLISDVVQPAGHPGHVRSAVSDE